MNSARAAGAMLIGFGNSWRGDDGVGPYVARRLAGCLPSAVQVRADIGDGLALIDAWRGADRVYVVDAVQGLGDPGTVVRIDALCETLPSEAGYSSHGFGLAEAVALARSLGQLPSALIIIGIEGADYSSRQGLSVEVAAAAEDLIESLRRELTERPGEAVHA